MSRPEGIEIAPEDTFKGWLRTELQTMPTEGEHASNDLLSRSALFEWAAGTGGLERADIPVLEGFRRRWWKGHECGFTMLRNLLLVDLRTGLEALSLVALEIEKNRGLKLVHIKSGVDALPIVRKLFRDPRNKEENLKKISEARDSLRSFLKSHGDKDLVSIDGLPWAFTPSIFPARTMFWIFSGAIAEKNPHVTSEPPKVFAEMAIQSFCHQGMTRRDIRIESNRVANLTRLLNLQLPPVEAWLLGEFQGDPVPA